MFELTDQMASDVECLTNIAQVSGENLSKDQIASELKEGLARLARLSPLHSDRELEVLELALRYVVYNHGMSPIDKPVLAWLSMIETLVHIVSPISIPEKESLDLFELMKIGIERSEEIFKKNNVVK